MAKDRTRIERGDLSFDGTHHYWANYFCDPSLYTPIQPIWADSEVTNDIRFNTIDRGVNRTSHHGPYALLPYIFSDSTSQFLFGKYPINPVGKTGISGRGQLGRWGPNHAADPIVVKRMPDGIYFVSIQRGDNTEWALPGGMVELGDTVSVTLRKEFAEEAMNGLEKTKEVLAEINAKLDIIFRRAKIVYQGYVDDPRNTDNAWMETAAAVIELSPIEAQNFKLEAGDDAKRVRWTKYTVDMKLYASHGDFIRKAIEMVEQSPPARN
jgi:ADP-ribose pyrophosphatase